MWNRIVPAVLCVASFAANAGSLDDYGRLPKYENVALSPDGKRAAFVTTVGNEREIIIQNFSNASDLVRFRTEVSSIRDIFWADDENLFISTSMALASYASAREVAHLHLYNLKTRKVTSPLSTFPRPWNSATSGSGIREIAGRTTLFFSALAADDDVGGMRRALIAFDLQSQSSTVIDATEKRLSGSLSWIVDRDGKPLAQSEYDEAMQRWTLRIMRDGRWVESESQEMPFDYPRLLGLGIEGGTIILRRVENDQHAVRPVSLRDGRWGDALSNSAIDTTVVADPVSHRLIALAYSDDVTRYEFIATEDQARWDQILRSFSGEQVSLESWSHDRQKVVVRVFGNKTGAGFVLVDLGSKQTTYLGDEYSGIGKERIARVVPFRYPAQDGLEINAYLTVPIGRDPKSLPLVVMPHGGPNGRDYLTFDWQAQALASRGYAVLQPNFRGSSGYGPKFQRAGYGEYGRKMQTDLSDGVRFLASKGIVDLQRVCIVGVSYGGYAALQAAVSESTLYRCAVSLAGVSDLRKQLEMRTRADGKIESNATRTYKRYLGVESGDDPVLAIISPIVNAEKVRVPILLIHGSNDSVVPLAQSTEMSRALRRLDKPHEYVKLQGEDHWLSKSETRIEALRRTVLFIEKHNPP